MISSYHDEIIYFYSSLIIYLCQCQMLNIALVCKYVAHIGH